MKTIFSLVLILILSYFTWKPLLNPGFFPMHDDTQVARLYEMDNSFSSGQFPVRWVKDLGFGYGYPLFNFYPPLSYYFGEGIHLMFRTDFINSLKVLWFIGLFGSSVAMYFLSERLFGRMAGIVSAIFYLFSPYHAVDAYVRGALAELIAMVWFPLVLLFSYKFLTQKKPYQLVLTSLMLAALMVTHQVSFVAFLPFFTIWFFMLGIKRDLRSNFKLVWYFLLTLVFALGVSAFFWIPAFFEKGFTLVDQIITQNLNSYQLHFVCLSQFWNSPWGYGASLPGCADGLSFQLGKVHILVLIASAFYLGILIWKRNLKNLRLPVLFFALLVLSLFMTTQASHPIWDNIKLLAYIQFPWRILAIAMLFASLFIGWAAARSLHLKIKMGLLMWVTIIFIAVLFNSKYFVPQKLITTENDAAMTSFDGVSWYASSLSYEYMSQGVSTILLSNGSVGIDITRDMLPMGKFEVLNGDLRVKSATISGHKFSLIGSSQNGAMMRLPIEYFPGWNMRIDGQVVEFSKTGKYQQLTTFFPAGQHVILTEFEDTPLRRWANLITIVSLIFLAVFLAISSKHKLAWK